MTDEDKWTFLREVPHRDAGDERIQQLARYLLAAAGGNERRFAMLAMTVAKDWIHQTSDVNRTGGEDIAGLTREPHPDDAVEALRRGEDDCDAKARLFVALCLAGRVPAEMQPLWNPCGVSPLTPKGRTLSHVFARVYLRGRWWPVELTLARARLGELGERVPKETDTGKWMLP